MTLSKDYVSRMGKILNDPLKPMKARFRALYILRNSADTLALELICSAFSDSSVLLKHELAYCLGQMQISTALPVLVSVLENGQEHPMVRHEAGEALGAIGHMSTLEVLEKYTNDDNREVAETCQLAVHRIKWKQEPSFDKNHSINPFLSIDPTPPFDSTVPEYGDIDSLRRLLIDSNQSLWSRYRAMFTLRNIRSDKAIKALTYGLFCEDSALFRHEIAYVLGQLQSPIAIDALKQRLNLESENSMVRHECAESLGSIGTAECQEELEKYLLDSDRIVHESCEVALDMADYENSADFQYACISN